MGNWDGGQVSTLSKGQTLTCDVLAGGQLYGLMFYNSQQHDQNATVNVVWSNGAPPVRVIIPGTTGNQGLASIVLVSGNDTRNVSASIVNDSANPQVQCWIASVSMPTNTAGITNQPLPSDGQQRPFGKYNRYYAVLPGSWHELQIRCTIQQQFISAQFRQNKAIIYIVNQTSNSYDRVVPTGSVAVGKDYEIKTAPTVISDTIQGDGTQYVWMNADSFQNSEAASISLQKLTK